MLAYDSSLPVSDLVTQGTAGLNKVRFLANFNEVIPFIGDFGDAKLYRHRYQVVPPCTVLEVNRPGKLRMGMLIDSPTTGPDMLGVPSDHS